MSTEEELQESVEHAHNPFDKRVAATMAIIAAALAIVAVAGQLAVTEELLNQQKASDQWSYYQAKSIRRYQSEFAHDLFASLKNEAMSEQYTKNAEKYRHDDEEIQKEAQGLERESHVKGSEAHRLHFGKYSSRSRSFLDRLRFSPSAPRCGTRRSSSGSSAWRWPRPP
jgi:hypothetical protein